MMKLIPILTSGENWLIDRILHYARMQDYVKYTSTLKEAWRLSINGLTEAVCEGLKSGINFELLPDDDYTEDPLSRFGVIEAAKHRERGIRLSMFLGLFKYYRESYYDLIYDRKFSRDDEYKIILTLSRIFDRIEIGFVSAWADTAADARQLELENLNRIMTNEKNQFLTVVESIASPVFFLDDQRRINYINIASSKLLKIFHVPGGYYYNRENISIELPVWVKRHADHFFSEKLTDYNFEDSDCESDAKRSYIGRISRMEDVSEKFSGVVIILNDITERKEAEDKLTIHKDELEKALSEIKTLQGIIPICASCKKIRDDQGYWSQVEVYIHQRSDAEFSHSICPDCAGKLYPGIKLTPDE
jgi:PAS domain-containing protein